MGLSLAAPASVVCKRQMIRETTKLFGKHKTRN